MLLHIMLSSMDTVEQETCVHRWYKMAFSSVQLPLLRVSLNLIRMRN